MKKNEEPFQMKGKGMAAAIAICFIAVVALVGAYTFSSYKRTERKRARGRRKRAVGSRQHR